MDETMSLLMNAMPNAITFIITTSTTITMLATTTAPATTITITTTTARGLPLITPLTHTPAFSCVPLAPPLASIASMAGALLHTTATHHKRLVGH